MRWVGFLVVEEFVKSYNFKMKKKILLEGQLYGHWKILSSDPLVKDRVRYLKCLCTKCNLTITFLRASRLNTTENNKCRNCYSDSIKYEGEYSELRRKYFSNIKSRAKRKKIPFEVGIVEIYNLLKKQGSRCKVSGIDISITEHTASLDRIDSGLGYLKNNIQWVHKEVNCAKNSLSQDAFINLCGIITKYNNIINNNDN